ncbi:hypothetical protein [Paramagnetospirillum kuznetsovii]|uniref:hypothetical protein n=1 Tax=Paramagnetospirillum kuznetsovii TaxID=2053833 RepID=UPI0011BFCBE8|nr:hypothetical protein [Paramagnetospirillum kuznetsovii]
MTYPEALAWTLILETPVVLVAALRWRCGIARAFLAALAASGVTHPVAWSMAMAMPYSDYITWGWYAIEAAVCCVEAFILGSIMRLSTGRKWGLSILANSVSAFAGWVVP